MCRRESRRHPVSRILVCWRAFFELRMENLVPLTDSPGPVFGRRDPDARGYFGEFGGRFVPETLVAPIEALTTAYMAARRDAVFVDELNQLLASYVGRPTPLYEARRAAGE